MNVKEEKIHFPALKSSTCMGWAKDKIAENILPCPLHLNLFWLIIIFCYEFSYIVMYNTVTRK